MKYKNLLIIAVLIVFIGCASVGDKPQVAAVPQSTNGQIIGNQTDTEQSAVENEQKKEGAYYNNKDNLLSVGVLLLDIISDIAFFHSIGW